MQRSYALHQVLEIDIPKLRHISDGLIFTSRFTPYQYGTDEAILKWKPPNQNSVDFLMGLEFPTATDPETQETYPDYESKPKFVLKVWHGGDNYALLSADGGTNTYMHVSDDEWEQMKSLQEPLDDRVVECYMDDQKRWRYMRFRDDKENGNHKDIFHKVMGSIRDGVSQEELLAACSAIKKNWYARQYEEEKKRKEMMHNKRNLSQHQQQHDEQRRRREYEEAKRQRSHV